MAIASRERACRGWTAVRRSFCASQSALVALMAMNYSIAQDAAPAEQPAPRQNAVTLLILQSGHVIEGRVSESPGGYVVDKPNGRMMIPFRLVRFQAANNAEAHAKMRQLYPEQNTQSRMSVAEWCLAQHMYQEAIGELKDALERDPNNADARMMLDRVETLASRLEPDVANAPAKPERTPDGFRFAQPESATGLSPEAVREFTSRIQPILLNKCGNAMCHGRPGEQGFALTHVRGGQGGRRAAMEKNLAQTMKYINTANPRSSALLKVPQGDHGLRGRPVFGGVHDDELLKTIETWIKRVGDETGDDKPMQAVQRPFPTRAQSKKESGELFAGHKDEQPIAPEAQNHSTVQAAHHELKQAESPTATPPQTPRDRFDPDAFNRAVLGGSRPTH
ncbi:MAG: hypothetical protein WD648_10545 [Planctomycetaceae bacterium]